MFSIFNYNGECFRMNSSTGETWVMLLAGWKKVVELS